MPKYQSQTPNRRPANKRLGLLLACAGLFILFLLFAPWEPQQRALNVDENGNATSIHEGLRITEIMSDNSSAYPDESGNFPDWVELCNETAHEISLKNITLSNRPDKAKFIFPDHILAPGERVTVFCDNKNQNELGKPYHAKFKLSSIQCSVYMFDSAGFVLDSVQNVPTMNANEVYSKQEDGSFIKNDLYSPGQPNTKEGHEAYLKSYAVPSNSLVINEICPSPRSGLRDEFGELSDWVEIKNIGDATIDLSNIALSDNPDRPLKWFFPAGAILPPQGKYLVFCSGKGSSPKDGVEAVQQSASQYPHTNFSLSAEGETLTLSTKQGQLIDRVSFSLVPKDCSYGRSPDKNTWQIFTQPTPGAENDKSGMNQADRYLRALNTSGVYLSELMSSNSKTTILANQAMTDWVELYNASKEPRDLSGWGLSDNVNWPRKWRFPQGSIIYPGEYKVLFLDKSPTPGTNASALHVSFALARAGGETMTLSNAQGQVLDRIVLPEIPSDISYGRTIGEDGFFYYDTPTPAAPNTKGFEGFAPAPILSKQGGLYNENLSISLEADSNASIRYTTDGSIPTLDKGQEYTGPVLINNTTVLRARAFIPGLQPSSTVTATYVLKTFYTLPVVCLTTDPVELWDPEKGIYAAGAGVDLKSYTKIPFKNPEPVYRKYGKIARPGYAEMFLQDQTSPVFSQGAAFGLIGQYSLDMPQKSFKVISKAALGKKYFNAKLFEDRPFDTYKSFVLRVSGNDCVWTRMADGVQSRLVDRVGTSVIHQAWKPVVVYLNGQYWGQYNMRERVSRYFVAQHEGLPLDQADNMTILEANGASYWGSNAEYKQFIAKVKTLSPGTSPEDLQYILDRVDVDNYFDYMIFESFFANTDTGNIRYYKIPGGKWKWILYDLDYGLFNSSTNGIKVILNPKGTGVNHAIQNILIRKILENAEMQDKFLRRYGEIFRKLTTKVMLEQIDICHKILEPEMMMHYERWASLNLKSISSEQPLTVDGCLRYWNNRVDRLRNVVKKRPTICYDQIKEWFKLSDAQMNDYFGPRPEIPADAK